MVQSVSAREIGVKDSEFVVIRGHSWLRWLAALLLVFSPAALAHQGSRSYLSIAMEGVTVTGLSGTFR